MADAVESLRLPLIACASDLGLVLDSAQADALLRHISMLQRWNATYNLTAIRDPAKMLTQHVADCLAVIGPLRRHVDSGTLLDVGSGGGLPGVLIAILNPRIRVTCVDSVGKKAAFVQQVAAELQLKNLTAVHARVEHLEESRAGMFDVIASRAFASLSDFTAITAPLLARTGTWLAMKGKRPDDEIAQLPPAVEMFHVEPLAVPALDAERCLIWMRPRR